MCTYHYSCWYLRMLVKAGYARTVCGCRSGGICWDYQWSRSVVVVLPLMECIRGSCLARRNGRIRHYNTRSTQKCRVQNRITWFDTKMSSLTKKNSTQHASVAVAIIKHPPPSSEKSFFQFYWNVLLLRTHKEMKTKSYWYSNVFDTVMKCEI